MRFSQPGGSKSSCGCGASGCKPTPAAARLENDNNFPATMLVPLLLPAGTISGAWAAAIPAAFAGVLGAEIPGCTMPISPGLAGVCGAAKLRICPAVAKEAEAGVCGAATMLWISATPVPNPPGVCGVGTHRLLAGSCREVVEVRFAGKGGNQSSSWSVNLLYKSSWSLSGCRLAPCCRPPGVAGGGTLPRPPGNAGVQGAAKPAEGPKLTGVAGGARARAGAPGVTGSSIDPLQGAPGVHGDALP